MIQELENLGRSLMLALLPVLLAACTASFTPEEAGANRGDRCLYAVEGIDSGRMTKWGSCSNPPKYAITRLSD
jgi:hypothetical protein